MTATAHTLEEERRKWEGEGEMGRRKRVGKEWEREKEKDERSTSS